jgi:hypothetical protein
MGFSHWLTLLPAFGAFFDVSRLNFGSSIPGTNQLAAFNFGRAFQGGTKFCSAIGKSRGAKNDDAIF